MPQTRLHRDLEGGMAISLGVCARIRSMTTNLSACPITRCAVQRRRRSACRTAVCRRVYGLILIRRRLTVSKTTIFTGAGVAIVTPMNPDGSVNYEKYRELIDWQIENGTDAIITCGTTGESSTLGHEEHIAVMRTAVEQAAGRVPVISGTGSNDTAYCIELSKEAEALGADGLLLVTPYYNKASQKGLILHYTAIADAVNLPIILYNVPSRTGVEMKPKTIAELAKHPRIVGVKEANGQHLRRGAGCRPVRYRYVLGQR